jgi:hypothetical protein
MLEISEDSIANKQMPIQGNATSKMVGNLMVLLIWCSAVQ